MADKVIKRDGSIVDFDEEKIKNAILGAMKEIGEITLKEKYESGLIAQSVWASFKSKETIGIEEIQDFVETMLMERGLYDVAKAYIRYRYDREKARKTKEDFQKRFNEFQSLIRGTNEEANHENSNKDTRVASVMRDYIAGFSCKEMARAMIPADIMEAHDQGIIHFHDCDYSPAMPIHNCELINLEDMLQNGTVMNEVKIDRPKSFRTACTVTSQISAQVCSVTYGGQTINLSHLAPFVDISRKKHKQEVIEELSSIEKEMSEEEINKITEIRLKKEIRDGIQALQYEWVTISGTNGQSAFITLFMYINDVPEGQLRDDLVLLIEEVLRQRIKGVKNKKGAYITIAFPKLIYVLDENNIYEDSEYWWLTKLAAECSSKRLVPDYVSAKKMKELKEGQIVAPMGCVDGQEVISYRYNGELYVEAFFRAWDRFEIDFEVKKQPNGKDEYIDLEGVQIYDTKEGFVPCYRIIRNTQDKWVRVGLSNGRTIDVTEDHPFETENRGVVYAKDLTLDDTITCDYTQPFENTKNHSEDEAWFEGFMICDGSYQNSLFSSVAISGEDEIIEKWFTIANDIYNMEPKLIERHRGEKGNYIDLYMQSRKPLDSKNLCSQLKESFGGYKKTDRHIPNEVFSTWDRKAKLSFLAGMIDADGYINEKSNKVQIGSTNKELALQQALLAQSLGMKTNVYINHYTSKDPEKIRYRIEFYPCQELVDRIVCEKKKKNFNPDGRKQKLNETEICEVTSLDKRSFCKKYSYDVTTASEHFTVSGIYSHNCRSLLSPWKDENGDYKLWGRFNQGVVTINLPHVALSADRDINKFWILFDERLDLCFRALMIRHNALKGVKSDIAPILWQHGALARLQPGETIDKLLYGSYSTISLGYAGLHETVFALTGKSLTSPEGHDLGLQIMKKLESTVNKWKKETNIGFALYGTPLETTTDTFARCLKDQFGSIKGITDKGYVTNSYHATPSEQIDAFSKLSFESEFQDLSLGGAISYVETPNMQNNIPALLEVMKHIYKTNLYAEINTTTSYCHICGCRDLKMEDDLKYHCPQCGNDDWHKMNIAVRVCGYISTNPYAEGRAKDIHDRVYHLGN